MLPHNAMHDAVTDVIGNMSGHLNVENTVATSNDGCTNVNIEVQRHICGNISFITFDKAEIGL